MTKIFIIDTDCFLDRQLFDAYFEQMPQARQEKIRSYSHASDKRLSLGAGVAVAKALSDFGVAETALHYDERGKPILPSLPWHISVSHSGHFAAVAVSDEEVGLDIERVARVSKSVVERVTTRSEQSQMKSTRDFFRLWTAKEAVLKITGDGISGSMQKIDLALTESKIAINSAPISHDYTFREFDITGYCLTVCHKGDEATIEEIKIK